MLKTTKKSLIQWNTFVILIAILLLHIFLEIKMYSKMRICFITYFESICILELKCVIIVFKRVFFNVQLNHNKDYRKN